ncbi:MAG: flagellar hook-associated protein FlgK [Hyphomicrobiales bacterium]
MGLTNVLGAAQSGLSVTQSALDVVARNIANADTPGYTRKTLEQDIRLAGGSSVGVRALDVTRHVNEFLQAQMRIETAAFGSVDVRKQFLERLDELFGSPGGPTALDTVMNEFSSALQQLSTSPESYAARADVVADAQVLAQQLRSLSNEVQALRQLAEDSIAQGVDDINEALRQLESINQRLGSSLGNGSPPADLLDQRDKFIDQISQYLEIRVAERSDGTVSVYTGSGNALLEGTAVQFQFDQQGNVTAGSLYSDDPAERGVGTILIRSGNGYAIDLIRNGVLNSGRLGALVQLRDDILVEAQAQLDELAHGLATAFSSKTVEGAPATVGPQTGFDLDVAGMQPGNAISVTVTTTPPGTPQTYSFVRVDDPGALPLANDHTANPNDIVIGIDFSGGIAAAAAAMDAALGGAVTVSNPGGTVLQFLDDGAANTTDINAASAVVTSTATQDDGAQLALFVDSSNNPTAYSGSLDYRNQKLGFASRIAVNTEVVNNNELLVRYNSSPETPLGDPTRPLELLARLNEQQITFSPSSGIGLATSPFTGTISQFTERLVSMQTGRAEAIGREHAARDAVLSSLTARFQNETAVDINQELSNLIELQNAFSANARVIQVVDELFDILFRL